MRLIDSLWNRLLGDPFRTGPVDGRRKRRRARRTAPVAPALASPAPPPATATPPKPPASPATPPTSQPTAPSRREVTPEREALIQQAMAVHRAKKQILDDLSDEQRRKLMVVAMRTLMNEDPDRGD